MNDPDHAIGIDEVKARSAAERTRKATEVTTGEVLPEGRPSKQLTNLVSNREDRAAASGISRAQQQKLDALKIKAPDKLSEV